MAASAPTARAVRSPSAPGSSSASPSAAAPARSPTARYASASAKRATKRREGGAPFASKPVTAARQCLDRFAEPAPAMSELTGQEHELRAPRPVGRQGGEPGLDGLGRPAHERATLAGDGVGGGVPVLAGDPLGHGVGPAPRRLEGVGQARRHRLAVGRRHLLLEAPAQELAEERMEGLAAGRAGAGQEEPAPVAESARRGDARSLGHVEVRCHARREQRLALLRAQAPEHLLLEVVVHEIARGPVRPSARGDGQDHPEGPALCLLHERLDLLGQRLAAAGQAQIGGAVGRREDEVGHTQLSHPTGGPLAREAQGRTPARRHRQSQRAALAGDQPCHHRQRGLGPLEGLGVVDDEHERVDEQPRELALQGSGRALRVDRLARGGQALGQNVDGARESAANRLDHQAQQPARVAAGVATAHPRHVRPVAQGVLERGRLAEARVRDQQQRAGSRAERISLRRSGRSSTGAEAVSVAMNLTIGARAQPSKSAIAPAGTAPSRTTRHSPASA